MGHYLNASQLALACASLGLEAEERLLTAAADVAANAIAGKLGIEVKEAAAPLGIGEDGDELAVSFGPAYEGQKCPEEIAPYDRSSDWADTGDEEENDEADTGDDD